jgi:hypothetical protein
MKMFQYRTIVTALFLTFMTFTAAGFYDPNLQRWVNRDPLGDFGNMNFITFRNRPSSKLVIPAVERVEGPNIYSFIHNNAVTGSDAFGLEAGYEYPCPGVMIPPITQVPPCETFCEIAGMVAAAACCLAQPEACAACVAIAELLTVLCIEACP